MGKGLKLADFGSCRGIYSKQPYTEYISTRWYRAPECLLTDGYYGPEMDMWGAGCVMFEITSLFPLFPGSNEVDQISRIHKVLGTPSPEYLTKFKSKGASHISFDFPPQKGLGVAQLVQHASSDSLDLMVKLLKYDASERITAREAMRHPYFKDVREADLKQQQSENKLSSQANTMPTASYAPAGSTQQTQLFQPDDKSQLGASHGAGNKPLPSIVGTNSAAADVSSKYGGKNNTSLMVETPHQQQLQLMQKQAGHKVGNASSAAAAGSSLPPIMALSTQNKFADPKTVRSMAPTNNTQKKRKKYRTNYVQQVPASTFSAS